MSTHTIYINGRFLSQRVTGIQRYARETLAELDFLIERSGASDLRWVLLAPRGTVLPPLRTMEARCVGYLSGHAWEQVELPLHTSDGLLISFASTGPVLQRHQVITAHDASVYRVPAAFSWKFKLWYRFVVRWVTARAPRTLAVSEFTAAELVRWFNCDPSKISVTSEGWQHLARQEADTSILAKHGLHSGRYVLAVSSPTPNKNFSSVVRAAREVRDKQIVFAIAGAADAKVFSKSQLEPSGQVKMLGYVSDSELKALYQHALCFVFPSRYEGFGIPPLEAMSLGCPVMAARIDAVTEVCGDAVRYFDPDDPLELARLVDKLSSDPGDVEQMRSAGLSRAPFFSWREAADRTLSAIQQVVR